ncbi:hypothetical protein ACFSQZ_12610 [Rubritalea spongiae]|uniref:Glycosyl hydrolase family 43 n=2 Tax=Rubritalea spongiae TaxID=430797 RepID=A0ABW5E8N2_9BACT
MKHIRRSFYTAMMAAPLTVCAESWVVDSQEDWEANQETKTNLELKEGMAKLTADSGTFTSAVKKFAEKKKVKSVTVSQSPIWKNWNPTEHLGPKNMADAPVFLRRGENDYWVFARYKAPKKGDAFAAKEVKVEGFDQPLLTTPYKNQFDAPGSLKKSLGGYHAWQSRDMKTWVHHGPVSDKEARWMTTAEQVGDKTYFYYDFPNDQDPHLIIDEDLTDGKVGKKMGMAFKDPSHGSDSAIIRDLDGKFHLILENWDPIKASARAWDSPLASHAVSEDGISDFKLLDPAVDYRTKPTGKMGTYNHPHWAKEDPANYSTSKAEYEIHEPEQNAYGDWAAIAIGGQYYLFGDYDPAGAHGAKNMQIAWFTSSSINEPFKFCGSIGKGHPDPDIMFAQGQFYLISQTNDFVSPGPWVDGVEVRVGVDTDNDTSIDQWTDWTKVKESYDYVEGFAKQVSKTPAQLDLSGLPEGFAFQVELRLEDTTENESVPIIDKIEVAFE